MKTATLTLQMTDEELNTLCDALVELAIADAERLEETEDEDSRAWLRASINRCHDLLAKMPISVEG